MKQVAPTKAETALLRPFCCLPLDRVYVPRGASELTAAVAEILASGAVGFDTESKPTFDPGEVSAGPHVVQFALQAKAYLLQLCRPECEAPVIRILESEQVLKVGFGLGSDRGNIRRRLGAEPKALVDLDSVFRKRGYRGQVGVRAAVAITLDRRFHKSKKVTTSNWARPELTTAQLLYAANDAFAALKVHEALRLQRNDLPDSDCGKAQPIGAALIAIA
jgi:ribonuclease D